MHTWLLAGFTFILVFIYSLVGLHSSQPNPEDWKPFQRTLLALLGPECQAAIHSQELVSSLLVAVSTIPAE